MKAAAEAYATRGEPAQARRRPFWRELPRALWQTISAFLSDNGVMLSAALAFYTALSFAPLLILTVWLTSFTGEQTRERVIGEVQSYLGAGGADAVRLVLESAKERPTTGSVAGIVSLVVLVISASSVFSGLKYALNIIWGAQGSGGVLATVYKRAIGFVVLCFVLAMLMASILLSAIFSAAATFVGNWSFLDSLIHLSVSFTIFTITFAILFKTLPDTEVSWRYTWVGAVVTTVLFLIGRWLTGLYLGHNAVGSAYGAGGALLVLLVWVDYSWMIVLFGAEFTHVWALRRNVPLGSP